MDHEKILRGIIQDLMKVPMSHHGDDMAPPRGMDADMDAPKEAHIEIEADGDPMKSSAHNNSMKKLHSSSNPFKK